MAAILSLFAVFVAATSPKSQQNAKKCCRMGQIFAVPIFGTSKPEKTSVFVLCHFFGDVKTDFRTHRWVLNGTRFRSDWALLPPDGC